MNTYFDFNRTGLLIQRYFLERFRSELIYWSIMAIVFMFIRNNIAVIGGLIFIAGIFYAARFFREIHSRTNGINYFMIPATQVEKLTVSLLFTIVYFYGMMILAYIVGNLLGTLFTNLLANISFFSFDLRLFHSVDLKWTLFESKQYSNIFTGDLKYQAPYIALFMKYLLLTQSIFTLGGIYFKNNQAFKTILSVIVLLFAFSIISVVELKIFAGTTSVNANSAESVITMHGVFHTIMSAIFAYLVPVYLWIISYFRLTEKEV
ncbi:MAG: hypothetical protein LBU22_03230 [Dysgonamonadaceae bacterium]|jgi:uncharacterized membrane protein|nr:hypothetical protein [Dysgonamonadaceae bacterium]